jgi:hypothetical protein
VSHVLLPERLRLEREQGARDRARVQRQRAAEAKREEVDAPAVETLDADRLIAAAMHRNTLSPVASWMRSITGGAASRASNRETTVLPSRKSFRPSM